MPAQKIMEGLGLFAMREEVDGAGYLGHEELLAAQRARADFGAFQERLAAEYLRKHRAALLAKQALREDIRALELSTDTGKFSDDEAGLLHRFEHQIGDAVDRLAGKGAMQRELILWFHRTPGAVKALLLAGTLLALATAFGRLLAT